MILSVKYHIILINITIVLMFRLISNEHRWGRSIRSTIQLSQDTGDVDKNLIMLKYCPYVDQPPLIVIGWNHRHASWHCPRLFLYAYTLIARFVGPTWGPSRADRTQVGPMLAPWTLLSGYVSTFCPVCAVNDLFSWFIQDMARIIHIVIWFVLWCVLVWFITSL